MSQGYDFINSLLEKGQHKTALSQINKALQSLDNSDTPKQEETKLFYQLYKSKTLKSMGRYGRAKEELVNLGKNISDDSSPLYFDFMAEMSYVLYYLAEYNESKDHASQTLEKINQLAQTSQFQLKHSKAILYHVLAINCIKDGHLDQAYNYLEISLHLREELGYKLEIAYSYFNLGLIHFHKGDLKTALDMYTKCYNLHRELGNKMGMAFTLSNIGLVQHSLGFNEEGNDRLLEGLKLSLEVGNELFISEALFELVYYSIMQNQRQKALEYLERMQQECDLENKHIQIRYHFAKALCLKDEEKIISKAKAQELLLQVIESQNTDFEIIVMAIGFYCDLLLEELLFFENPETLVELRIHIIKLRELGEANNSYQLIIEALMLESKLDLMENNISHSLTNLKNAISIAKEHDIDYMLSQLQSENASIINRIEDKQEYYSVVKMRNLIQETKIKEYLEDVARFLRRGPKRGSG